MDDVGIVYHIKDIRNTSVENGYIGVTKKKRGIRRRYITHSKSKYPVGQNIRRGNANFDNVEILFEGSMAECYAKEKELRPNQNMGWNLASGGGGPYFKKQHGLSKFRSRQQSDRMSDPKIRKQQSESFKENYYANPESQKLRRKRAVEHMSDPTKKSACLRGMHKKIKCPYCNYKSNSGNVAQHVKRMHPEKLEEYYANRKQ